MYICIYVYIYIYIYIYILYVYICIYIYIYIYNAEINDQEYYRLSQHHINALYIEHSF